MDNQKKINNLKLLLILFVCLVPLVGAFLGITILIDGRKKNYDQRLKIIGIIGILTTIITYSYIYWYSEYSSESSIAFKDMSKSALNKLSIDIEDFKTINKRYPKDLIELSASNEKIIIYDPMLIKSVNREEFMFEYKNLGNSFELFSIGADEKPYTKDDIFPDRK